MRALITIEDGLTYRGVAFGYPVNVTGEIVFQTGMVGYVESLTDPSYFDQLLILTYPLIGNYGVPHPERLDENGLHEEFESSNIWAKALICDELSVDYSHWNASISLDQWLKLNKVVGIQGVDVRALTKDIRINKTRIATITIEGPNIEHIPRYMQSYVAKVSTNKVQVFNSTGSPHILLLDCGVKLNQIRCFLKRGAKVTLVPYNYNFLKEYQNYDGLFISNGPGNPTDCQIIIDQLKAMLKMDKPIFGICLGHQLISLAAGCKTYKMDYGNRGHNQPCILTNSKRCFVTSQNHGYAVDSSTIPSDWNILFTNANDNSNEGIYHQSKPFFSVQFHPEHRAGPDDLECLFDVFLEFIKNKPNKNALDLINDQINISGQTTVESIINPRKVLILGSGGLSIGQAGEFDYSGSQALKALKEEDVSTVLINPNIATVQTNPGLADKVYFLPITVEYVEEVVKLERPEGIMLMFGGQTALNCGIALAKQGILKKYNIKVLGTPIKSIENSEDRAIFAQEVTKIGYEVAPSKACENLEKAIKIANDLGYPLLVRAAFSLGGLGSGFAENQIELESVVNSALKHSNQVLLDKSLKGWKEVEYEVIRDAYDNCIAICNMENVDPLGIHTGESIVVAPSQTLSNFEYFMLRSAAFKIVRHLQVVGECNVQFALNPNSREFFIIEVNPRLSRSSALASKATGYPLAYVAAKLSLGIPLCNLKNSVTGSTTACFEPSLDYVVVKIPRWDLAKFAGVSREIGSSMKSVGEVMAIGRRFEEAFQKALRMAHESNTGLDPINGPPDLKKLSRPTDIRIFELASALNHEVPIEKLYEVTKIDKWFLYKMQKIIRHAQYLKSLPCNGDFKLNVDLLWQSKKLGFSDKQLAQYIKSDELTVRAARYDAKIPIVPFVRRVDTVAAEYPASTNYLYLTYNAIESDVDISHEEVNENTVIVIGSGVYRIGSSVEFDCCSVGCVTELRKMNKETIMINYNPETVSTDYDMCDKLYFDEISCEVVLDIYKIEKPLGIILSMGGQLPNNIAMDLKHSNAKVLGTSPESIDEAEDRFKFSRLLDKRGIKQPQWRELVDRKGAESFAEEAGYPCIVRPSYVLSGAGMIVASNIHELQSYLDRSTTVNHDHPVVISKYIMGAKEIDVDAVACDGELVKMAVSEHVENAGVHSGDATLITPPTDLNEETLLRIKDICQKIGRALQVNGPYNMQLIAKNNQLYVIECNLRVSRSFPFVSKTINFDFVALATRVIMGEYVSLETSHFSMQDTSELSLKSRIGVKVPQFSFSRLAGADFALGVEMASTGEVACFGENKYEAYLKALQSTGFQLPKRKIAFLSIGGYERKDELLSSVKILESLGYKLIGSIGTADYYKHKGIQIEGSEWFGLDELGSINGTVNLVDAVVSTLTNLQFDLMIDIPRREKGAPRVSTFGYRARRFAIDHSVPLISDVKCARLLIDALNVVQGVPKVKSHIDCLTARRIIRLPGLIDVHTHMREPGNEEKEDFDSGTSAALAGGITMICVMPNTNPPIVDFETLNHVRELAKSKARCDFALYVGASPNNAEILANVARNEAVVGLKMYLNTTYGTLCMPRFSDWIKHFENWPENLPIVAHAESLHTANIIMLAKKFNRSIHICHVARYEELYNIILARELGVKVTCEVCPHHLFLCEDDIAAIGHPQSEVRPCLVKKSDQDYLWANLDAIDCFATDHAPHLLSQKINEGCPGFPGLETILALLLTAVHQKRLTLKDLVDKMYVNPKKIFHLPDQENTYVEIDFGENWVIPTRMPYTKADWTPFSGMKVTGKVHRVMLRGEVCYIDGKIFAPPGYGKEVVSLNSPLAANVVEQNISDVLSELYGPKQKPELTETVEVPLQEPKFRQEPKIKDENCLQNKDIISVEGLDYATIRKILDSAHEIKKLVHRNVSLSEVLRGQRMCLYFHEASSRTFHSFKVAIELLGGHVGVFERENSSMKKGESFEDTMKTIESYYNYLVIRHPDVGAAKRAANCVSIPVINGGDGTGEHPSQALLDLFTIREEIGTIKNLKITLAGDLLNGRTVHSLAKILVTCGVDLRFVSPPKLAIPDHVKDYIKLHTKPRHDENGKYPAEYFKEYTNFDAVIDDSDVIYMTRLQEERFDSKEDYIKSYKELIITPKLMRRAKKKMILLHPLPRVNEISPAVDQDSRAAYFRQMANGLPVRMALLALIAGKVVTAI